MSRFNRLKKILSRWRTKARRSINLTSRPVDPPQQNTRTPHRNTTLLEASRRGDIDALQNILRKQGAIEEGEESLRAASRGGHAEVVLLLLQHGVDPNTVDSQGEAALHKAVLNGHGKVVRLLVEHGADPFLGRPSALSLAEAYWNPRPLELFQDLIQQYHPEKLREDRAPAAKQATAQNVQNYKRGFTSAARQGLWPDRHLIYRGERMTIPPSHPVYWN